jgi:transposase-like protein
MAYPAYLRERARQLRTEKHLSIDEIAERLALPRTTVYYWVRDMPLERERNWSAGQRKGTLAMQATYRRLREEAHLRGLAEYDELVRLPTFRDFVVLHIAEGYKRSRNTVSLANSDAAVISMTTGWLRRLSDRKPTLQVQHHADQNIDLLRTFWSAATGIEPTSISFFPKTNSSQLRSRTWRCVHGVASVAVHDTLLRARLEAWMNRIRETWE